jgi:hypothetical protein
VPATMATRAHEVGGGTTSRGLESRRRFGRAMLARLGEQGRHGNSETWNRVPGHLGEIRSQSLANPFIKKCLGLIGKS